jgi:hypothetical protein
MIETTFKEAIKRRSASIELSATVYPKNGATDMIRANYHREVGSSSSTPFNDTSDSVTAYSDSFKVELGRNDFEKAAISKRADIFLKWMWRECYNQEETCAMRYGKKRCSELLHSCNCCYQIYLAEERHCSSCHKTFKSIYNFSDHTTQCEEKWRTDPYWKMQIADYSVPIGMVLLKLQLVLIEVKSCFGGSLVYFLKLILPLSGLSNLLVLIYRHIYHQKHFNHFGLMCIGNLGV